MRQEASNLLMQFAGVGSEHWRDAAQWAIDKHAEARNHPAGTLPGALRVNLLTLHDDDLLELIAMFTPGEAP